METAITVSNEIIDATAISIVPRGQETPMEAVQRMLATYKAINTLIDLTFKDGVDYDYPAGTKAEDITAGKAKKNLLLPGMEKTRTLLGLREEYRDIHVVRDFDTPFFYFEVECIMYSIASGLEVGRGQGICHTREKSFMRSNTRVCPNCGQPAIKKSNFAPRGAAPGTKPGWYCHDKAGGCNAQFAADDASITSQETGNAVDPQLVMDGLNRCRKIANKRAKGDATKNIGMMSGRFTVDMEDFETYTPAEIHPPAQSKPAEKSEEKQPEKPKTARECLEDEKCKEAFTEFLRGLNIKTAADYTRYTKALGLTSKFSEYAGTLDELKAAIQKIHDTPDIPAQEVKDLLKQDTSPIGRTKKPEPEITDPAAIALLNGTANSTGLTEAEQAEIQRQQALEAMLDGVPEIGD